MANKVSPGRSRERLYDGSSGDPTVVWFDPGGTTGWAVISVHPVAVSDPHYRIMENITHYAVGQYIGTEFDQVEQMIDLCAQWPGAVYGTEQFILLKPQTSEAVLSPVRLNAVLRYGLGRKGRLYRQLPSLAKSTMTDDRLDDMGYLEQTRGMPHGRDALRHNLTFWKRVKTQRSLRLEAFPRLV